MKSDILYPGAFPMVRVELAAGEHIKAESGAMVASSSPGTARSARRMACRPVAPMPSSFVKRILKWLPPAGFQPAVQMMLVPSRYP